MAAVQSGLGVALIAEPYLQEKGLVAVRHAASLAPSLEHLSSDGLWLVAHRALRDVPRVAVVWEFLAHEITARSPKGQVVERRAVKARA